MNGNNNNNGASNTSAGSGSGKTGPRRGGSSGNLMGIIPRKKLPPLASTTASASASSDSTVGSRAVGLDAPIPRRKSQPAPSTNNNINSSLGIVVPDHQHRKGARGSNSGGGDGGGPSEEGETTSSSIRVVSETPFVVRIPYRDVVLPSDRSAPIATQQTRSTRPKRPRRSFQDLQDTDSDDMLTDSDDNNDQSKQKNQQPVVHRRKLVKKKQRRLSASNNSNAEADSTPASSPSKKKVATPPTSSTRSRRNLTPADNMEIDDDLLQDEEDDVLIPSGTTSAGGSGGATGGAAGTGEEGDDAVDSPPMGTLASLWYSHERYLHVFVLERVCGWKTRPKLQLIEVADGKEVNNDEDENETKEYVLDSAQATALQQKALQHPHFWADVHNRMEVSRISPRTCPLIMAMAALQEENAAKQEGRAVRFRLHVAMTAKPGAPTGGDPEPVTEEVLLVKWRGRSYLHCSWERASDLQRLDVHSNNTARNKIRRFYQMQETAYGTDWKAMMEEERTTASKMHNHHDNENATMRETVDEDELLAAATSGQDEEFLPSQSLEIERILLCDEGVVDTHVLAKQRAINIQLEQELIKRRDQSSSGHAMAALGEISPKSAKERILSAAYNKVQDVATLSNDTWDPEDNVRYVVKWKGLPYAEMTWEYWRDIKLDAVDEVEDFWHRQQPPSAEELKETLNQPHPHVKDFRKLQTSPTYGISSRTRPVADLSKPGSHILQTDDDEADSFPGFRLRNYQLEGVNWLLFNWWNKRSCILADEMGLGKTIQSAAFIQELQRQPAARVRGPFLIVAPLSLIGQWQSEFKSWAPDINSVLYHGSADARDFLVKHEFYYIDPFVPKATAVKLKKQHVTKFDILITTYEVALKDIGVLSKIKWKALVVDEAHRLKNPKARLFEQLANVPRDFCVLLTGTPIANATSELHALLNFANPSKFADKTSFLAKFGEMTDAKQVNELHSLLKPYLLRRVKEDVEKSLPPKEETILEVTLTPIQKTFYKAIYERNTSFLYKGAKASNAPSLMNVMMELRKCCNHPFLVKGAEERILADAASKMQREKEAAMEGKSLEEGSTNTDFTKLYSEQLVKSSGKMVLMEKLLHKLFTGGHKVLVFSQMVRVLDLLEELLRLKKYRYERLDGSTSSSSRAHAVDRFTRKSFQRFVMLLSTRAGGLGLNLTAADIVVIFDSDWNPQNDLQAMARAHRIGQTRSVRVYRLLTAKTYEMHMFHSASLKLGLERAVLSQNRDQGEEADEAGSKNKKKSEREAQAKEIDELLKKGAYDVFRDDDDGESERFMETDIDQLLEHSSKKVTYGPTATSSLGSGLGSFSKASFVANTDDGAKDVDLDDPDFWSKAVGLDAPVETTEDAAAMLDDGVKRNRKQVQVYDPYAETAEAEQRKKEKAALEKIMEKEEKERLRQEKKLKKKELMEKKKKEREEHQKNQQLVKQQASSLKEASENETTKKVPKDAKPKKSKKNDRMRAIRRAENEDPVLERLKQAWEVPQRNRATAASIRYGFGRFCKIRNESNLAALPLQDVETFVRSYVYQLALQFSSFLLERFKKDNQLRADDPNLRLLFTEWLGFRCPRELEWIVESAQSVMRFHMEVENRRRFLRMPIVLAEPAYVEELRRGCAFRALRRVGVLARLNKFVENCLDSILSSLGYEELGKRGCARYELSRLDADLKARYVTTEELGLYVGSSFSRLKFKAPAAWWNRSCDVALIIGTFVHGMGNYEAMRSDPELPFSGHIQRATDEDLSCKAAAQLFRAAAGAARLCFDEALESARVKAELEVQAAVAAAAKAASQREEDAAMLRKGGAEAEAVIGNMPDTQVENAFAYDGTDSHFVTLQRLHKSIQDAVQRQSSALAVELEAGTVDLLPDTIKSDDDPGVSEDMVSSERVREPLVLPMPDARVLDHRLLRVLMEIENVSLGEKSYDCEESSGLWPQSDAVSTSLCMRSEVFANFHGDAHDIILEYSGVGIGGNQCGSSHRSLNDGSDYGFGSASLQLSHVAYGTDSPRYLRALGVPMNLSRFAVTGLVYAESSCVREMLTVERVRFYGTTEESAVPAPRQSPSLAAQHAESTATVENISKEGESGQLSEGQSSDKSFDPKRLIPDAFRDDARLRAAVCLTALFYGFPMSDCTEDVDEDLLDMINQHVGIDRRVSPVQVFNLDSFREAVGSMLSDTLVPDSHCIASYMEKTLLPHCLRLCVSGNGPSTRNARGSQGAYETSFGVSVHAEPSQPHPSPLPDPCLDLQEHSLEALGYASAILRRARLMRSAVFLCRGKEVSMETIQQAVRSRYLGNLRDMPVWWCPWIHDLSLLVQAATGGLFSIMNARNIHPIFAPDALQQYMYSTLLADGHFSPARHSTPDQITSWAERQSHKFPSLFQVERRLAFLCARATADISEGTRFDNLPMFDHGGWPRN